MSANAEVKATNAWVRATVPAQKSTGAFMTLTSTEDAKVVGVSTPAATSAELHSTMQHGNMMHMEELEAIELPAGKAVALQPGGRHVMLMGLARRMAEGEKVPLTLTVEDGQGKRTQVEIRAEVRAISSR